MFVKNTYTVKNNLVLNCYILKGTLSIILVLRFYFIIFKIIGILKNQYTSKIHEIAIH
ncbi:hypothetical protein JOC75_002226 [Metabacillus crassostreae]|nr:hypothetical protein [Metabacillus crassostreae]